jgi:ABC-type multidrug transport system fused ATPase/permease subunit
VRILEKRDRNKIFIVVAIQSFLGIVDLIGVALIGVIGALSIASIESGVPGDRVQKALEFLRISDLGTRNQVFIIALVATFLLVARTLVSVVLTRKTLVFLGYRGVEISQKLLSKMLNQDLESINSRSVQHTIYIVTSGVEVITLRVLISVVNLIADGILLVIMAIGLFVVNFVTALFTISFFLLTGAVLYISLNLDAHKLGIKNAELGIKTSEMISDAFTSYREAFVRNRREFFLVEIGKKQYELAKTLARISFIPFISKYVIEISIMIGALAIGGLQFYFDSTSKAVGTLAIFLAATGRIAPAFLRIQQGLIAIKGSMGLAKPTLDVIENLEKSPYLEESISSNIHKESNFSGSIQLNSISFKYKNSERMTIKNISLEIYPGEMVAIVGPSGSGKTTLIDLILGTLTPTEGTVLISHAEPKEAIRNWPDMISYVPQDVVLSSGSIKHNITLGFAEDEVDDQLVWQALQNSRLASFVEALPDKLNTLVGENGSRLSGGQKQRLGIARAILLKPKLLILDEATSSLDAQTESEISQAMDLLKGSSTLLIVAHRLSTVRNSDRIIYLNGGSVEAIGNFDFLKAKIPDFAEQARLLGL